MFSEALATAKIPVLDVASRYREVGDALLPVINPIITTKYGLEMTTFVLENVSVPPEVEEAIDKRSSMAAVGNLNDYVKFQLAQGMEKGGAAGAPAELAMGFAVAQQLIQQQGGLPQAAAASSSAPVAPAKASLPELLTPADAANILNVSEADVLQSLESGDLKGRKIGSAWRITREAMDAFLKG